MKKKVIILLSFVIFILTPLQIGFAKMSFLPPERMITFSDNIIIWIIEDRNYNEDHRKVTISVNSNLKGQIETKEIVLVLEKPLMYGWHNFDFPTKGTKVLLFLSKSPEENLYNLASDGNNIAVIGNENDVELFNGVNTANTIEQYEYTYENFLEENHTEKVELKHKYTQEIVSSDKDEQMNKSYIEKLKDFISNIFN